MRSASLANEPLETLAMQRDRFLESSVEAARALPAKRLRQSFFQVKTLAMFLIGVPHRELLWQMSGFASRLLPQGHVNAKRCSSPQCVRDDARALGDSAGITRWPEGLRVGTVERNDLRECCRLVRESFNPYEWDVFDDDSKWFEYSNKMLGSRLINGGTQYSDEKNGMMLAAYDESRRRIVGLVELSIVPRDGMGAAEGVFVPGDTRKLNEALSVLPWVEKAPDSAYMGSLCVAPSWRRQGMGKALIRICQAAAKEWGFSEVYVHVAAKKPGLLDMYARYGFERLPKFDQYSFFDDLLGVPEEWYHRKKLDDAK